MNRADATGAISGTAVRAGGTDLVDPAVLRARAYLSRVAEASSSALLMLIDEHGPVQAAARVADGRVPAAVAAVTEPRRGIDRAEADLATAADQGARLLVPEHPDWPSWALQAFGQPGAVAAGLTAPLALWVRGPQALDPLCGDAVGVVGARAATRYGQHVAHEFGAGAAAAGHAVVSGGAIGVDASAHRGALAVGGVTVAVLACGIDVPYPPSHETLLAHIAATGLLVSEYPPGAVPARHRFLVRNRLIAALSAGVVVVEAGLRSGTRRTATDAVALGRPLMAVPGPVTSGLSAGCHRLVQEEGALLVTRVEEVREVVGRLGVDLAAPRHDEARRPTDGLSRSVAMVHDALPTRAARDTTWLAAEAGLDPVVVRAALVELERRGLAEYRHGRWQRPGRRSTA